MSRKVLLVAEGYLETLGGAEFHVFYMARALRSIGWRADIFTGYRNDDYASDELVEFAYPFQSLRDKKNLVFFPVWLFRLLRAGSHYDIIHAHYSDYLAFISVIAGWLLRKPVIITLHGQGTLDSSACRNPFARMFRWVSMKFATKAIATSDEMASVARRYKRLSAIPVITNGVDTQKFRPENRSESATLRLATVRRLVPKNGVQFVVEAIGKSEKLRGACSLTIIGDGRLEDLITQLIDRYGLHSTVTKLGAKPHSELPRCLAETDCAIFMSTAESVSLAALECMAAGVLVLCSNAGAFPDFVSDGETGFIAPIFSNPGHSDYNAPESLTDEQYAAIEKSILRIREMPGGELDKIRRNARLYVENEFDWRRIAEQTAAICYDD